MIKHALILTLPSAAVLFFIASSSPSAMHAGVAGEKMKPEEIVKIGFDGNKVTVSQVRPGVRTIFGRYILTNEELFKDGI